MGTRGSEEPTLFASLIVQNPYPTSSTPWTCSMPHAHRLSKPTGRDSQARPHQVGAGISTASSAHGRSKLRIVATCRTAIVSITLQQGSNSVDQTIAVSPPADQVHSVSLVDSQLARVALGTSVLCTLDPTMAPGGTGWAALLLDRLQPVP